ncbi:hypothetical protein [Methanocaldococcus sp.]
MLPADRIDNLLYAILEELLFLNQSQKLLDPCHFEKNYVIRAGSTLDITNDIKAFREKGIVKLIQIKTDSEEVIFELQIDANKIFAKPRDMADWGLFGEFKNMFFILKYDNTVSPPDIRLCYNTDTIYTDGIRARIINPTSTDVNLFISIYRLVRKKVI